MSRLVLIFLHLFAASIFAANDPSRTCRILFLNAPENAPEKMYLSDGASALEVELARMSFSPVYEIRVEAEWLALLSSEPAGSGAGRLAPIPENTPVVKLDSGVLDFYLIVTSDGRPEHPPLKLQVIRADGEDFGRGKMLWYNLTDHKVGGQLGKRKLLLGGRSRKVVDAPADEIEEYRVSLYFQPPGSDSAEPLCETAWSHDPRSRTVFFVIQPQGAMIPRVIGIPDFRGDEDQ